MWMGLRRKIVIGLALVPLVVLTACGNTSPAANSIGTTPAGAETSASGKLRVVATTSLVGDTVRQVGGDLIELTVMLPPGVDAHSYEPTPKDVAAITDADVVFVNGVGLEGFMTSIIENAGGKANIVEVSRDVELIDAAGDHAHEEEGEAHASGEHDGEATAEAEHSDEHGEEGTAEAAHNDEHGHDHEGKDPHVWFNPLNVGLWASTIEQELSKLDQTNAATYKANAEAYQKTLQELDSWAKQQVAQIPEDNRKLVTDHDTFGYLAEHYGFELIGAVIPSVSSAAEASAQEVAQVQEAIRQYNVPAVFVASEASGSLTQQVTQDTGTKLVPVYVESLSAAGGEADTYEKFMRHNIGVIVEALK